MKLAMATRRPENVLGLHFFNPVPVQHLVELIPSIVTSEDAANRVEEFVAGRLEKRVIRSHDRAGFIVNFLFVPYVLSAIRMLESGFASAEDIDAGMVEGCSHPMGPLALADLIGLDTIKAVADSMYEEFKEPLYSCAAAPPPHGGSRIARPEAWPRLLRLREIAWPTHSSSSNCVTVSRSCGSTGRR